MLYMYTDKHTRNVIMWVSCKQCCLFTCQTTLPVTVPSKPLICSAMQQQCEAKSNFLNVVIFTAQCTLVHMRGLGIACRLSVRLSVCL